MKAIAKTRPELGVEIIDAPMPRPGPDQVLVRVAACGICGSDLHIYLWELGADRALSRMPAVIGHEPAGEVVELGAGVSGFKVGDHVALDPFGPCGKMQSLPVGTLQFLQKSGTPRRRVRGILYRSRRQRVARAAIDGPRRGRPARTFRDRITCG